MLQSHPIRKATAADSDGLKDCMACAYAVYQQAMEVRLPPMDADYALEIKNYPTWVIESDGQILAGLIISFENDQAYIANIAVSPKSQGQGIGRELMNFAETIARAHNYSQLRLTTHALA